ncbi:MaoC/PaaZ C-terminal domain-containing protein [Oceanobacillus senegalensis]|uniref:MaoC/PaaZ C-terminal domain-containing protein n=1 Tax=Oceanobacillus senegalensis TaxID=1936063 RepID=UPI000A307A85|nr:MaoC/PaaZ C-terminal domain-containing protein [Oceanobacillus senegalensis]
MNTFEKLYKGRTERLQRMFTEEEVKLSSGLTRDYSPVYDQNEDIWKNHFYKPIVPALLTEGLITQVISTKLPGIPSVLLQKDLVFNSPVYVGDMITAELVIIDINEERNWVTQKVTCFDVDGKEVIRGQVVLLLLSN